MLCLCYVFELVCLFFVLCFDNVGLDECVTLFVFRVNFDCCFGLVFCGVYLWFPGFARIVVLGYCLFVLLF